MTQLDGARPPGGAGPAAGGGQPVAGRARRAGDHRRTAFLVVLALVIVLGAGWALLGSSLLVVRHVRVSGNHQVSAAAVRAVAGIPAGTPLARLDTAAAARRIENLTPVLSARVTRSWPDTVVITIRERTAALAVAGGGGFELVDIDGVVLRTVVSAPVGLPVLRGAPVQLRGSPAVRSAVLVLGRLPGSIRRRVASVATSAVGSVTLHLRDAIVVRWGDTSRSAAKARELRALMRTGARFYDVSSPGEAVTGGSARQ
jgi:cell division protein FtsQ